MSGRLGVKTTSVFLKTMQRYNYFLRGENDLKRFETICQKKCKIT